MSHEVCLDHRIIKKALGKMPPREKLLGEKPDVLNLRVCGSVAFYNIPKPKQGNKQETHLKLVIVTCRSIDLGLSRTEPDMRTAWMIS